MPFWSLKVGNFTTSFFKLFVFILYRNEWLHNWASQWTCLKVLLVSVCFLTLLKQHVVIIGTNHSWKMDKDLVDQVEVEINEGKSDHFSVITPKILRKILIFRSLLFRPTSSWQDLLGSLRGICTLRHNLHYCHCLLSVPVKSGKPNILSYLTFEPLDYRLIHKVIIH